MWMSSASSTSRRRDALGTLANQSLDAAIVAGITALSMLAATQTVSPVAVLVAFGLTFLVKLGAARGLK